MSSQKSYVLFCHGIGLGGLELQMAARVTDAISRGDNAVLVCIENGKLAPYARQKEIPIETIPLSIPYIDPVAIVSLGKLFKKNRTNVCIVGSSHLLSQALLARKFFSPKTKVVFYQQMQSGLPKRDWFHNRIYRSLDAAIVLTDRMNRELETTTVMNPKNIHTIPFGIKSDQFQFTDEQRQQHRKKFNIPDKAFVIGSIGRLDPNKDQLLLLEAFAISSLPADSLLVLCGDETPGQEGYGNTLREFVSEHKLTDRVLFLPFTNDVPELLSSFDVFVLPSRSETFGLVVIEAMAAGLPVIATNSGGVPEIIEENKTGLLFNPGDKKILGGLLSQLAASNIQRQTLGDEARKIAMKRYDYNTQTQKFFDVCDER